MHCKFFSYLPIVSCNVKVREYGKYFFEASQNKFEVGLQETVHLLCSMYEQSEYGSPAAGENF